MMRQAQAKYLLNCCSSFMKKADANNVNEPQGNQLFTTQDAQNLQRAVLGDVKEPSYAERSGNFEMDVNRAMRGYNRTPFREESAAPLNLRPYVWKAFTKKEDEKPKGFWGGLFDMHGASETNHPSWALYEENYPGARPADSRTAFNEDQGFKIKKGPNKGGWRDVRDNKTYAHRDPLHRELYASLMELHGYTPHTQDLSAFGTDSVIRHNQGREGDRAYKDNFIAHPKWNYNYPPEDVYDFALKYNIPYGEIYPHGRQNSELAHKLWNTPSEQIAGAAAGGPAGLGAPAGAAGTMKPSIADLLTHTRKMQAALAGQPQPQPAPGANIAPGKEEIERLKQLTAEYYHANKANQLAAGSPKDGK